MCEISRFGSVFSPNAHAAAENPPAYTYSSGASSHEIWSGELSRLFSFYDSGGERYLPAADNADVNQILANCQELFSRDYTVHVMDNSNGRLCNTYPPKIFIPMAPSDSSSHPESAFPCMGTDEWEEVSEMCESSRIARVWRRFPVPVIVWNGENVCRSSTLATKVDVWLTQSVSSGALFGGALEAQYRRLWSGEEIAQEGEGCDVERQRRELHDSVDASAPENIAAQDSCVGVARCSDIQLLKRLGVRYICDLMVEGRKKKLVSISSSEKVDSHRRYSKQFILAALPYPGCEFFKKFTDQHHTAYSLKVDWDVLKDAECETCVDMRSSDGDEDLPSLPVDLARFKDWNLVTLTGNYLKVIIRWLGHQTPHAHGGLLVHCISGWDRTPLFISLLRLSLWADGQIHQSLSPSEILYLTIAYDWLLFSHQLKDRKGKGENVMYFCFYLLDLIADDAFSVSSLCEESHEPTTSEAHEWPSRSIEEMRRGGDSGGWDIMCPSEESFSIDSDGFLINPPESSSSPLKPSPTPSIEIARQQGSSQSITPLSGESVGSFEEVATFPTPSTARASRLHAVSMLFKELYGKHDMQKDGTGDGGGWLGWFYA